MVVYRRSPLVTGTTCPVLVRMLFGAHTRVGQGLGPRRLRSRKLAVRATACSGVTSNALATALMASRREKLDPSRVRGSALTPGSSGIGPLLLVDRPVVQRYPRLPFQDPEHLLHVCCRGRCRNCVTPEGVGQVVDRCRSPAALPVGEFDRRRAAPASLRGGRRAGHDPLASVAGCRA